MAAVLGYELGFLPDACVGYCRPSKAHAIVDGHQTRFKARVRFAFIMDHSSGDDGDQRNPCIRVTTSQQHKRISCCQTPKHLVKAGIVCTNIEWQSNSKHASARLDRQ